MQSANALVLGADRALYLGDMPATGLHRHACPVFLLGLSGRFALHLPGGSVVTCQSALVDTGVEHVFDPQGEQVAVMYLEPDAPETRALLPWLARNGGVMLDPAVRVGSRSTAHARLCSFDLSALLTFTLDAAAPLDPRISQGIRRLRQGGGDAVNRDMVATAVNLSASRFNHLFRQEAGVSFRSYRVWTQVRSALAGLATSPRLTDAALEGAFVDSSHFSRTFRQTFGMTPSSVLKPLRSVTLVQGR